MVYEKKKHKNGNEREEIERLTIDYYYYYYLFQNNLSDGLMEGNITILVVFWNKNISRFFINR